MGQQQLILLVLSSIVVALAILVGIRMFESSAGEANQNAVLDDVLTLVTEAQKWYRRPAALGGGGRSFQNCTLENLRFKSPNMHGRYELNPLSGGDSLEIVGTGFEDIDGDSLPLTVRVHVGGYGIATPKFTH